MQKQIEKERQERERGHANTFSTGASNNIFRESSDSLKGLKDPVKTEPAKQSGNMLYSLGLISFFLLIVGLFFSFLQHKNPLFPH